MEEGNPHDILSKLTELFYGLSFLALNLADEQ